jgi:putative autotransporter adhesin-like protein
MRAKSMLAALALCAGLACKSAQQRPVAQAGGAGGGKREVSGFSAIEIGGAIEADVAVGPPFSVVVSGDERAIALVTTEVHGEMLVVGRKQGRDSSGHVHVAICLPVLAGLELEGASQAQVSGLVGAGLRLAAGGASRLVVTGTRGEHLALDASGASSVAIDGAIDDLVIDVSGASHVQARALVVSKAVVDVSGASTLELNGKDISGDASGASTVQVWGGPSHLAVDTSGASSVRKMQ